LAGGLNAYGFAAGDPINYSDPYGLRSDCRARPCPPERAIAEGRQQIIADVALRTRPLGVIANGTNVGVSGSAGLMAGSCSVQDGCGLSLNLTPQYGMSVDVGVKYSEGAKTTITGSIGVHKHLAVYASNEEVGVSIGFGVGSPANASISHEPERRPTPPILPVAPDNTRVDLQNRAPTGGGR
jgi:hypothetical protein